MIRIAARKTPKSARLMYRWLLSIATVAMLAAGIAAGTAARASAAVTLAAGTGLTTPGSPDQAYDNCYHKGYAPYCDYNGTNGSHVCFWSPGLYGSIEWGNCRNHDESFANRSGGLVRLYYSPNEQGAWACVNNGWYSNDLNKDVYTFNNGSGAGAGQEIWENVASDEWRPGRCTNPLPEDG